MLRHAILLCLPKELVNSANRALMPIDLLDKNWPLGEPSIGKRRRCVKTFFSLRSGGETVFMGKETPEVLSGAISHWNPIVVDKPSFLKGAPCRPTCIVYEPAVNRRPDNGANCWDSLQDLALWDINPQLSS